MKLKEISFTNIGPIENQSVSFNESGEGNIKNPVIVFIGNNGSGKTTILKSIATSLSWFVSRVRSPRSNGESIPEHLIKLEKNYASISVTIEDEISSTKKDYTWRITKARTGKNTPELTSLNQLRDLAFNYRENYTNNDSCSLPLIIFYPVERAVLDVPLRIRKNHTFNQINGYSDDISKSGVDFRTFFEWFRQREDVENETVRAEFDKRLHSENTLNAVFRYKDPQLEAVRSAISKGNFGFDQLKVERKPHLRMTAIKNGNIFNITQLSQGEKILIALIGDISRRLAIMNPSLENPLEGEGIIMIDEIDMHLHPQWQSNILDKLSTTFPNCQFIVTTHSPIVIGSFNNALFFSLENGNIKPIKKTFGKDVNLILNDYMATDNRNSYVKKRINNIIKQIENNNLEQAENDLSELKKLIDPTDPEVNNLDFLLASLNS